MSPQPLGGALSGGFQEPASSDPTSAPVETVPTGPASPQSGQSTVSQTLAKRKKGFGPGIKNPADLGRAIALAKRARPSGRKYG